MKSEKPEKGQRRLEPLFRTRSRPGLGSLRSADKSATLNFGQGPGATYLKPLKIPVVPSEKFKMASKMAAYYAYITII